MNAFYLSLEFFLDHFSVMATKKCLHQNPMQNVYSNNASDRQLLAHKGFYGGTEKNELSEQIISV